MFGSPIYTSPVLKRLPYNNNNNNNNTPVKVGAMEMVKVTYTSPLQVPLTDAEFTAEGTALTDPLNTPV